MLVIAPTRELVQQIFQELCNLLGNAKPLRIACVFGGKERYFYELFEYFHLLADIFLLL